MGVYLDHGARNGVAGKPIAQSIVPVVMLGWEPLLDPSPVGAEMLPCPLQADFGRLVALTENYDALHMGRYADMGIALGTEHSPNRQLKPVNGGQGIFDPFGDAQNVIRLTKPHAARTEQTQRELGLAEGASQNVCGIEESPVDRDQAKLISHCGDHCGKAAPILPLSYDRLWVEANVRRRRIKAPSMKIGFSRCAGDGDAVLP